MFLKVGLDKGSTLQLVSQRYWAVACQVRCPLLLCPIPIYKKLRSLSQRENYIDRTTVAVGEEGANFC
jgi:hypothetical protein